MRECPDYDRWKTSDPADREDRDEPDEDAVRERFEADCDEHGIDHRDPAAKLKLMSAREIKAAITTARFLDEHLYKHLFGGLGDGLCRHH